MEPAVASDGGSLRFAVGARVSCNMGREGWASGEIVATRYREAGRALSLVQHSGWSIGFGMRSQ